MFPNLNLLQISNITSVSQLGPPRDETEQGRGNEERVPRHRCGPVPTTLALERETLGLRDVSWLQLPHG